MGLPFPPTCASPSFMSMAATSECLMKAARDNGVSALRPAVFPLPSPEAEAAGGLQEAPARIRADGRFSKWRNYYDREVTIKERDY